MEEKDRFVCLSKQGKGRSAEVWVDTQTGVNYLFLRQGYAGGLTPLLDSDGKVVVSKEYIQAP